MAKQYDKSNEPIVISKSLLDIFFNIKSNQYANIKNPADAIALYIFYYYTAKWQKTNNAKATTSYTAKGLEWSEDRVRKNKKILISLDLIEDIISKDKNTNKITGHYIYVKFLWSSTKIHPPRNPESGNTYPMENLEGNALSDNNRNALSDNNRNALSDNKETIINDRNRFENKSKNIPVKLKEQDLHSLRLIQYWVNLEHTTQHNTNKPYNKSCLQMIKYLSDLQKGSFAINRRFNSDWIKKENIPENWFTKAWTYIELREGLKQASKYALEGYWPNKNKENFKSLSYILYNDFGDKKRSWLFTAMKNPPQTIKESFQKIPLESVVNKFIENPIWPKDYEFDKYRLGKGLTELKEFSDNLIRDQYNRSHEFFGSLSKLLKEYVTWIDEQNWIEIKENIIGTKNKVFGLFIEAQEKELEIKIKSKGWK